MASLIENYGIIGDTTTAALVSTRGSIDWLCLPAFDSDACFASLVGYDEHGRWVIQPTRIAIESAQLQADYFQCWQGLTKHFDPERR